MPFAIEGKDKQMNANVNSLAGLDSPAVQFSAYIAYALILTILVKILCISGLTVKIKLTSHPLHPDDT